MIYYQSEDITMPKIAKRKISAWVKEVAKRHGYKVGDVSYIFCSDEKILEVNKQYLQHDYFTDIITFDYTEGKTISGDLFISLDTVRTNAEQFHASYDTELHRVIIHGMNRRKKDRDHQAHYICCLSRLLRGIACGAQNDRR